MKKVLLALIVMTMAATGVFADRVNLFSTIEFTPKELATQEVLPKAQWLVLNEANLSRARAANANYLELNLTYQDQELQLVLHKAKLFEGQPIIKEGNHTLRTAVKADAGLHYRGVVKGDANSSVSLSLSGSGVMGLVSYRGMTYVLGKFKGQTEGKPVYVLYAEADLKAKNPFSCAEELLPKNTVTPSSMRLPTTTKQNKALVPGTCRGISSYLVCNYGTYVDFGRSTQAVVDYVTGSWNMVARLYEEEDVRMDISEIMVFVQPDTFRYGNSREALYGFTDYIDSIRPTFTGDLAHLIDVENNGLGGVAFLNAVCMPYNTAYSNSDPTYAFLPVYSWTIGVLAHEVGHNMSSRHTQNCGWDLGNGVNGMLDSCWTPEGGCYSGPRVPRVGTIMSYCHLTARIDLALGFGNKPGTKIKSYYDTISCVTGFDLPKIGFRYTRPNCVGDLVLTADSLPGYKYYWEGPNGSVDSGFTVTIANPTPLANGVYFLTYGTAGCMSIPMPLEVNVSCFQTNSLPIVGCIGDSVKLAVSTISTVNTAIPIELSIRPTAGNPIKLDTVTTDFKSPVAFKLPILSSAATGLLVIRSLSPTLSLSSELAVTVTVDRDTLQNKSFSISECEIGSGIQVPALTNYNTLWLNSLGNLVAQGNNLSAAIARTGRKFYLVREALPALVSGGLPDTNFKMLSARTFGSYLGNFSNANLLTVTRALEIQAVTFYPQSAGVVAFTVLDNSTLREVFRTTMVVTANMVRKATVMSVGAVLTPGQYRVNALGSSVAGLFRNNQGGINYPLAIGQYARFTGSSAGNNFYYYFYNYQVQEFICPTPNATVRIDSFQTKLTRFIDTLQVTTVAGGKGRVRYSWSLNGQPLSDTTARLVTNRRSGLYQVVNSVGSCNKTDTMSIRYTSVANEAAPPSWQVYPNPSTGLVNVLASDEGKLIIRSGVTGQVVKHLVVQPGANAYQLEALPSGVYWLEYGRERGTVLRQRLSLTR